jgi:hypothetical protein
MYRLGSAKWKGTPLAPGVLERIGPREVELDTRVPASQIPRVVGAAEDAAPDADDAAWEVPTPHTPSRAAPGLTNSTGSARKFIMPVAASFYASAAPKAQGKGPL